MNAPLILSLLLASGCGSIQLAPNQYHWSENGIVAEWYRWDVVSREEVLASCPDLSREIGRRHAACAIRLNQGIVNPGDVSMADGRQHVGPRFIGKLCIVRATLDEEGARRVTDKYSERPLRDHEIKHCDGFTHTEGR